MEALAGPESQAGAAPVDAQVLAGRADGCDCGREPHASERANAQQWLGARRNLFAGLLLWATFPARAGGRAQQCH